MLCSEDGRFKIVTYLSAIFRLLKAFECYSSISIAEKKKSHKLFNKLSCEISVKLPTLVATPYQPVPWLRRLVAITLTAEARVPFQAVQSGICSGRSVIGSCFSPNISFFSWYHSTNASYSSPTLFSFSN